MTDPILSDPPELIDDLNRTVREINHACASVAGIRSAEGYWFLHCKCGLKTLGWPTVEAASKALERMHDLKQRYMARQREAAR